MLAEKVAELAKPETETYAGIVKAEGAELARVTAVPPAPAALENVSVQMVELLDARLVAAHCTEDSVKVDTSDRVTGCEDPLSDAVTVAV